MLRFSVWKTMLNLTHRGVEIFIQRYKKANQESFWKNYDLLIWRKDANGYTNVNGMFRENSWGMVEKIPVDNKGIWKLPKKYVKYFR